MEATDAFVDRGTQMAGETRHHRDHQQHAFASFNGRTREGLTIVSRRGVLKASLAGIAGLSVPALLHHRAAAGVDVPKESRPR